MLQRKFCDNQQRSTKSERCESRLLGMVSIDNSSFGLKIFISSVGGSLGMFSMLGNALLSVRPVVTVEGPSEWREPLRRLLSTQTGTAPVNVKESRNYIPPPLHHPTTSLHHLTPLHNSRQASYDIKNNTDWHHHRLQPRQHPPPQLKYYLRTSNSTSRPQIPPPDFKFHLRTSNSSYLKFHLQTSNYIYRYLHG